MHLPPKHPPRHVYVHVPFCSRRCSYCDFSIAVRRVVPVQEYLDALDAELSLRYHGARVDASVIAGNGQRANGEITRGSDPWEVDTLYFGGGTPTRLGPEGVAAMLDVVRRYATLATNAEVTLEANPEDITIDSVAAWRRAGVNRLSIGAQSFDDEILKWMHRTHDAAAISRAANAARSGGIDNFSVDLIFSLPDGAAAQARSWSREIDLALELQPAHLSLYGLTIEPHTPLGKWRDRGDVVESPEEQYESEFLYAHHALTGAGLEHYEVSNFGRPGQHSRHNSSYWSAVPYAGLGPSAHEFDGQIRRWNASAYADWLAHLARGDDPVAGNESLTEQNRIAESVYLGLRTLNGLLIRESERARIAPWVGAGWGTVVDGERLVLSPSGWLRLDALAADLTLVRSHY